MRPDFSLQFVVLRLMATAMLDECIVSAVEMLDLVFQVSKSVLSSTFIQSACDPLVLEMAPDKACCHEQANEQAGLIERSAFYCDAVNQVSI